MTFNLWTFVLQLFNFLVLAYVLHRLLYRPLREAIDRRRQEHERAQSEANRARDEARALQEQLQTQLAALDRQRQEIVRQSHEQAVADRQRLLDEADRTVQQRYESARQALARERTETLEGLHAEIVEQAVNLSRRLLAEAANLKLESAMAQRLIESLRQLPQVDRDELRRTWQPRDMAVLETSAELNGSPLVDQISAAASDILGQRVALKVERRESLVVGVRLRLGGRVWDSSLAGQLEGISQPDLRGTGNV
jgi:F-type H+-transporting ATPase subunit b